MTVFCLFIMLTTFVIDSITVSGQQVSQKELEHFSLLNQLRAAGFTCPEGQRFAPNPVALKFDCRLWRASQLHSQDMADQDYFSHTSRDGRSFVDRGQAQGIFPNAENIAAGRGSAQDVLDQWKGSDGHCKNMLNPARKLFAVGYGFNSGSRFKHYWTQMLKNNEVAVDESCLSAPAASSTTPSIITTSTISTNTDAVAQPTATTTLTTDTTTTTTVVAQVEGSLVLDISNSSIFAGDAFFDLKIEAALAAAIADVASVDISTVTVTFFEPRRLQSETKEFSTVSLEYTITVLANEAAVVVERIVSTELALVTTVVAQRLSDATFDGVVKVTSFSANIVANDSTVDVQKDFIDKLIIAGAGTIFALLLLLCCCCCYRCCCRSHSAAKEKNSVSLPV